MEEIPNEDLMDAIRLHMRLDYDLLPRNELLPQYMEKSSHNKFKKFIYAF